MKTKREDQSFAQRAGKIRLKKQTNMNNHFQGYELKKPIKAPPHQLADHCDRLCKKLGIPFCTPILRFLKQDEQLTESLVAYMAEKGIKNVRYLTVAFNRQRALRKI